MNDPIVQATASELAAALLQAAITLGLALLCALLYRRYRKPYFGWWAIAWFAYMMRVAAIITFMATTAWTWLYWHQVVTGWTGLVLLWAALVFSRQLAWRWRYAWLLLFPPVWSYIAIYRMDNFLLAAGPAVLFLSAVTLGTGGIFLAYARRVRSTGARILGVSLLLWGLHHLDYPFLRARGAWSPWGYYLDIMFLLATGAGILVLVLDDQRRGLEALSALSGDLSPGDPAHDGLAHLLERPLSLPAARGAAMVAAGNGAVHVVRGVGGCAGWEGALSGPDAAVVASALARGRPEFVHGWPDPRDPRRPPYAFAAVLPVLRGESATEALLIVGDARDPFTALDEEFLLALGRQIGAALDAADLQQRLRARTADLQRLSARMIEQHEEERRRVSLELHDETAQVFSAVKLQLGLLRERAAADLGPEFDRMGDLVDTGIRGIRNVTNELRPSLLDDLGLLPALRALADEVSERTGVATALEAPESLPPLAPRAELALFRALQEALSNVVRHSGAEAVLVTIGLERGGVALRVADDGRGFGGGVDIDRLEAGGHLGLVGMRERVAALGGVVTAGDDPDGGAGVTVWVPSGTGEGAV